MAIIPYGKRWHVANWNMAIALLWVFPWIAWCCSKVMWVYQRVDLDMMVNAQPTCCWNAAAGCGRMLSRALWHWRNKHPHATCHWNLFLWKMFQSPSLVVKNWTTKFCLSLVHQAFKLPRLKASESQGSRHSCHLVQGQWCVAVGWTCSAVVIRWQFSHWLLFSASSLNASQKICLKKCQKDSQKDSIYILPIW